ncbi:MAG: tetratricopeptide repeat protein [Massilia sp.]
MKTPANWLLSLLLSLLAGCAGVTPARAPQLAGLFNDNAFGAPAEPVSARDLFTLSPEMRAYLRSPSFAAHLRAKGSEHGLVDALYSKGDLKLEYDASMTRTAAQTYAARAGNCLSLVIMTAAFARELGMPVRYQSVDVEGTWSRNGGLYLVSSHVNLSLGQRLAERLHSTSDRENLLTIDFLPPEDASRYRTWPLDESDIVAMYMNNRAAEALVGGRIDDAYWWARAAVTQQPRASLAYNTLGVVYQRKGDMARAERVYRAALEVEAENLVVMQNLAPTLAAQGKFEEARALEQRIAAIQPAPPFHYFNQGMQAFKEGDYQKAKALFEREVRRGPYNDEFHFWLAIACLRLGEPSQAREQLAMALDTSTRNANRELYSAKLAHLRSLRPSYPALHRYDEIR